MVVKCINLYAIKDGVLLAFVTTAHDIIIQQLLNLLTKLLLTSNMKNRLCINYYSYSQIQMLVLYVILVNFCTKFLKIRGHNIRGLSSISIMYILLVEPREDPG
jgi:hypothetical protein